MMIKTSLITPDPRVFIREHNRALREANMEAAKEYHEEYMGDHFKMIGYEKYGIPKRSKKYNARKHKKYNHTLPLVFSGMTRQLVLSQRRIRATPKGARLEMRAAFRGGTGRVRLRAGMSTKAVSSALEAVRRKAELESTAQSEIDALAKFRGAFYVKAIERHIRAGGRVRKRRN